MNNSSQGLGTRRVFGYVLLLGLFSLAARRIVDPDLWWHLRTGQLILQNHAVFRTDPFSYTRSGQPWLNHEWLSDILMFALYRGAGWGGLIVAFAALLTATYFLAYRRSAGQPFLAGMVTLWAASASLPVWDVRPQIFSLCFASMLLTLYHYSATRPRILWWSVPLMLLWVNLHAGYALGIALLALFLLGDALQRLFPPIPQPGRLRTLALVLPAALAVVPFNPYGTQMYGYPLSTLRSIGMQSHIAEWFSPDFHQPQYLPLALLMLATIAALALSPRRLPAGDIVLLLATNLGALLSARHIAIYCLVVSPVLCLLLDGMFSMKSRARTLSPRMSAAANLLIIVFFTAFVGVHLRQVVRDQAKVETRTVPVAAVDFLSRQRMSGRLLNNYDWGGYLIWRLYPNLPVFIDGRADVYGDALMKDFADASSLSGGWQQVLDKWSIRAVLLPADSPLVTVLKISNGWKQIYADSQAVILTR